MRIAGIILFLRLFVCGQAWAYQGPSSYEVSANLGGGAGRYFTGSSRWLGYTCDICHVAAAGLVGAELVSEPADLTQGFYRAGAAYQVTLRLVGEHLGGAALANRNTFVADIVDDEGAAVGQHGVDGVEVILLDEGRVVGSQTLEGRGEWAWTWTAPPAGAGPITIHGGIVDANGAEATLQPTTDVLGDDVAVLTLRACEDAPSCARAAPPEDLRSPAAGCAVGDRKASAPWFGAVVALALVYRRRGRLLVLLVVAGCHDPVVPAECRDLVCGDATAGPPPGGADGGGNPSCREDWICSPWEAPMGSDQATRMCTDKNMLGTTECKPTEGPVTLPPLDLNFYKCQVEPIFDRGCSMMGCHGTDTGRPFRVYARGRFRNDEIVNRTGTCIPQTGTVNLQEAGSGTVMCEGWTRHTDNEWKKNFDSARSFLLGVSSPEASDLLAQPKIGGKPHAGVHMFAETDADYRTVLEWLRGGTLASCTTGSN